jgi:hypothetical protein
MSCVLVINEILFTTESRYWVDSERQRFLDERYAAVCGSVPNTPMEGRGDRGQNGRVGI